MNPFIHNFPCQAYPLNVQYLNQQYLNQQRQMQQMVQRQIPQQMQRMNVIRQNTIQYRPAIPQREQQRQPLTQTIQRMNVTKPCNNNTQNRNDNVIQSRPTMSHRQQRKRAREYSQEDESSDSEISSSSSRNHYKKRRLNRDNEHKSSEDDDDDDDEEEDSDIENTNNGNNKYCKQIEALKIQLKQANEKCAKLEKENKTLRAQLKDKGVAPKVKSNKDIEKMRKRYFKKWSNRLMKVAGMKKTKFFCGGSQTIIVDETGFDGNDFESLFDGKGELIQPLPHNKPTSKITIRRFDNWDDIAKVFEEYGLKENVQVNIWRKRNFAKTEFRGTSNAEITNLDVCYNKSSKKLSLKFKVQQVGYYW